MSGLVPLTSSVVTGKLDKLRQQEGGVVVGSSGVGGDDDAKPEQVDGHDDEQQTDEDEQLQQLESLQQEQVLTFDPKLLRELQEQAVAISDNVLHVMGGLQAQVHAITNVTLKSTEAYNLGTQNVSKAVSKCMDDTLLLINKTDELNAEIAPIYTIATQIKDIKKTLDILESMCK